MSSGRRTSVARPAQYTPSGWSMPTAAKDSAYTTVAPVGTRSPAPRSTRTNATAIRSGDATRCSGATAEDLLDEGVDALGAEALLVLAVLDHGAERGGHAGL